MKRALISLTFVVALFSCKKTETAATQTCPVNNTTVPGTYKLDAVTYKSAAGAADEDYFATLPDCQKDDTYTFGTDGTITLNDVGVNCFLPPSPTESWGLEDNATNFRISDNLYLIESFDCTKLVISKKDVTILGDKETRIYIKQ
jgi:hypothetical protein